MIEGMLNNAGELESQPFLRQMGASLAETHPLPASETVGSGGQYQPAADSFHWGRGDHRCRWEDGLRLRHQALPVSRDEAGACAGATRSVPYSRGYILAGCRVRGGSAHVILQRERVFSVSDVQFLYYHP